jgi:hypothetical protein
MACTVVIGIGVQADVRGSTVRDQLDTAARVGDPIKQQWEALDRALCVASKETLEGPKSNEFDQTSRDPQAGR